ncbi:alkylation response protein AidB-like acyl-CoA dehydrogenase [Nocardioides luteus]|uniref:Acyl-CoA dehydrogenase n=1 Tax=Nocardioides luteus TaxID=1844 RepID=A0ABQ5T065_9ACTN|nr:acyl-CoA dehydrogenase family protein [Nocardioides luteus]MDR7312835.1 alkylation response protein AidB-like acyl-CoA dehydrogenase [Nocardioides luteus]GGR47906.1 acyl-CoA dehydrogenase [Nocardioides luteus]GLJ69089.1 acyl-CoA dehydrogenase [Nocardioides luteus]
MRFALTEEQSDLVATVHTLIAKRAASTDLRAAIDSDRGYDQELWRTLTEQIGVTALAIPETYGGVGCSYIEAHLVLEELGATLTPSPLVGTVLASEVVQGVLAGIPASNGPELPGLPEPAARLLAEIADGTRLATVAPTAPAAGSMSVSGDRLTGSVSTVLDAPTADTILVVVDDQLFAVDRTAPGCEIIETPALDPTLRLGTVQLTDAPAALLGTVDPAYVTTVGATMMTALQAGAARVALERTVAYLKERHQFGRPLGSFQALKHRCADLLVQVETAKTMSWAAAWELSQPEPDVRLVRAAKTWCSDAFSQVAAEMIQLHGGVAITWEHDAHLYFKRAHATAQLFATPAVEPVETQQKETNG